jgi:hypothetical protein
VIDCEIIFKGDIGLMGKLRERIAEIFEFKDLKEIIKRILFIAPEKMTVEVIKKKLSEYNVEN